MKLTDEQRKRLERFLNEPDQPPTDLELEEIEPVPLDPEMRTRITLAVLNEVKPCRGR